MTRPITGYEPGTPVPDSDTGEVVRVPPRRPGLRVAHRGRLDDPSIRGHKQVFAAVRSDNLLDEVILGVEPVPDGDEMAAFMRIADRTLPNLPGAQAVLYDGALRGKHADNLMRTHGVLSIAPVSPYRVDKNDRRKRVEHKVRIQTCTSAYTDGRTVQVELWGVGGVPSIARWAEDGARVFEPLVVRQITRRTNRDGTYRFYADLVAADGADLGLVRLDQTAHDRQAKINRPEHFRGIHSQSQDHCRLCGRRSSAESLNERYEASMYRRRATGYGANRVLLHGIFRAFGQNAIASYLRKQRGLSPPGSDLAA